MLLDIEEHAGFIFGDNMEAGLRFPEACDATFERLLEMPLIGSARRFKHSELSGLRLWPVEGFPKHLVFYFVREDGIEIIRVLHGAQDIESILEGEA